MVLKGKVDPGKIIDRAAALISLAYPQGEIEPGVWRCWSQRYGEDRIYTVTATSCTCWMGENRRSLICKHRWACFAPFVVEFIQNLRENTTTNALRDTIESYLKELAKVNRCYVDYARTEYRLKRDELKEVAA